MKTCPHCHKTYADDSLEYCLADGATLSAVFDPQATRQIPPGLLVSGGGVAQTIAAPSWQPPVTPSFAPDSFQTAQSQSAPKKRRLWPFVATGAVALVLILLLAASGVYWFMKPQPPGGTFPQQVGNYSLIGTPFHLNGTVGFTGYEGKSKTEASYKKDKYPDIKHELYVFNSPTDAESLMRRQVGYGVRDGGKVLEESANENGARKVGVRIIWSNRYGNTEIWWTDDNRVGVIRGESANAYEFMKSLSYGPNASGKSASATPATKEDATKQILSQFFDACLANRNAEAANLMNGMMSKRMKEVLKKTSGREQLDYSIAEDKQKADNQCRGIREVYGNGYEFGSFEEQREAYGWNIFPQGNDKGQIWAFTREDNKHVLIDIDPVKR